MTIELLSSDRLIVIQYKATKNTAIAEILPERLALPVEEQNKRADTPSGERILEPTKDVWAPDLTDELQAAGFEMVNAFREEREHPQNPTISKHIARFDFLRSELIDELAEEFIQARELYADELRLLTLSASFQTHIWRNPLFNDGEVVEGQSALSVNLEARSPLFNPDGTPRMVWPGEKGEGEKVPLEPTHQLSLSKSEITIK